MTFYKVNGKPTNNFEINSDKSYESTVLDERPQAVGISAPGMPSSSPGMNTSFNTPYDVYLIDQEGNNKIYASH